MAEVTVNIHPDYIAWLFTADDSPTADALDQVADLVLYEALSDVPVSPVGSKYAPPGFTKSRIIKADETHGDDGLQARFVGTRLNIHGGAANYPLPFFENAAGETFNRGHKSKRKAVNYFLQRALETTPFTVYEYE